jgi:hypothetical protein
VAIAALPLIGLALYVYRARLAVERPVDLAGIVAIGLFLVLPRKWAAVAVVGELLAMNAGFNALVDAKYFRPPLPILAALRAHAPREPFRVVGRDWVLLPNASAQYGLEDIRGSDPMADATYDSFLRRFTVQQEGTWVRRVVDVDRPELDFLNVRFLLAEPDAAIGGKWRELYRGRDGVLFENARVGPRFFGRGAEVLEIREVGAGAFSMRVRARAGGEVASSEPFGPGWRVRVGGRETRSYAVEGGFVGFRVPAGEWPVHVWYQPLSYRLSGLVALIALAGVVFWRGAGIRGGGVPLSGVPAREGAVL